MGFGCNKVSGSGRAKMTHKNGKISCLAVLDVLFLSAEGFSAARTSLFEA
jgi:hypothetical protein